MHTKKNKKTKKKKNKQTHQQWKALQDHEQAKCIFVDMDISQSLEKMITWFSDAIVAADSAEPPPKIPPTRRPGSPSTPRTTPLPAPC